MAKPKSFIQKISIDHAKRAHDCQHSSKHRILKGDPRLALKVNRSTEYFCKECALKFLENDANLLSSIITEMKKI